MRQGEAGFWRGTEFSRCHSAEVMSRSGEAAGIKKKTTEGHIIRSHEAPSTVE